MTATLPNPPLPSMDKRWRIVDATMRRHGHSGDALIETLHTAQEAFGYLDESGLRWVASTLHVPLSKVYGVATFYHYFTLKPPGKHTCVICMGTACYIKGAASLLEKVGRQYQVEEGQTTEDGKLSMLTARCLGSCGLAPAVVVDGEVLGRVSEGQVLQRLGQLE